MISQETILDSLQQTLSIAVEKEVAAQMEPIRKECTWEKQELSDQLDGLRYERDLLKKTLARLREESGRLKTTVSGNLMIYSIRKEWGRDFEPCDAATYARFALGEVIGQ